MFSSVHASQKVLKVNIMRIPELQMKCFISDASVGDGWLHKYDTDVYYMEDGEWNCYGRVSVYKNLEDDHDRNWVDFNGMKFPTEETNKGGYSYKVQYGGTWYYF